MISGRLTSHLEVFEPVAVLNRFGEESVEYVHRKIIRAERVRMTGRRSDEAGEHFADYRAEFNIRYQHVIGENWRVREVRGYEYTVVAIVPNRDKAMTTLVCERVNL